MNEQSFITFTGLDYATFEYLLSLGHCIVVARNGDGRRGRPQSLEACLGLVLGYTSARDSLFFSSNDIWSHSFGASFVFAVFNKAPLQGVEGGALCQD